MEESVSIKIMEDKLDEQIPLSVQETAGINNIHGNNRKHELRSRRRAQPPDPSLQQVTSQVIANQSQSFTNTWRNVTKSLREICQIIGLFLHRLYNCCFEEPNVLELLLMLFLTFFHFVKWSCKLIIDAPGHILRWVTRQCRSYRDLKKWQNLHQHLISAINVWLFSKAKKGTTSSSEVVEAMGESEMEAGARGHEEDEPAVTTNTTQTIDTYPQPPIIQQRYPQRSAHHTINAGRDIEVDVTGEGEEDFCHSLANYFYCVPFGLRQRTKAAIQIVLSSATPPNCPMAVFEFLERCQLSQGNQNWLLDTQEGYSAQPLVQQPPTPVPASHQSVTPPPVVASHQPATPTPVAPSRKPTASPPVAPSMKPTLPPPVAPSLKPPPPSPVAPSLKPPPTAPDQQS